MTTRKDIQSICVIGAGPIVIGQACEFDYSGTQACKALRAEGYRVVLVNSNPATIMTDPDVASATYIEPLTAEVIASILERERVDALLPTLGGQTALNLALELHEAGVLERLGIEMLGANPDAIEVAEDRERFKALMVDLGLEVARSGVARSLDEARDIATRTGIPCVLRPSFTLGGVGGGIVEKPEDFESMVAWALEQSPVGEVLIEESLVGWKEYEMEVMRDCKDRAVIVCSIENLDPMGVHTGDSITVAPAQTLTDREYQAMRNASLAIIRAVGVETGGSNIQFAVDPRSGRMVVIEMNPRVSRSSALASKATGFPIAKLAALLAVGHTLDGLQNEITRETPACFEPALDYVVTKIPRFAFEKFPGSQDTLTTQMKSVGEVMAIGQTFGESLCKALRSLESPALLPWGNRELGALDDAALMARLARPHPGRLAAVFESLRRGVTVGEVCRVSRISPWFVAEIDDLVEIVCGLESSRDTIEPALFERAVRAGLGDEAIAALTGREVARVRDERGALGLHPVFKRVDTCAAEFAAHTPYLYSTWADECESQVDEAPRVIVLGSGPNRIGQGIEFDYSCVKAVQAAREAGFVTVMVNCNPETVSTDHDTSDRLYFEPIDVESVLEIVRLEKPVGVIVQLGGQTPLRIASALEAAGVPILGTAPSVIEAAEDREAFSRFAAELGLRLPAHATASTREATLQAAETVGYPVVVRPSRVLGGRAMAVVHDVSALTAWLDVCFGADGQAHDPQSLPILIDAFLDGAVELDVDAVCDGERVIIGGVLEQIERAGVHSGDSACLLPAMTLSAEVEAEARHLTREIALRLGVVGLVNVQMAVTGHRAEDIYILEVNPRASRTVPFISKATGTCMTTLATRVMLGSTLDDLGVTHDLVSSGFHCKEVVLPFSRFPGVSPTLGPEMRSTGEVMASGENGWQAYARAQLAAGNAPASDGAILLDVDATAAGRLDALAAALDGRDLVAWPELAASLTTALGREVAVYDGESALSYAVLLRGDGPQAARRFRSLLSDHVAYFTSVEAVRAWHAGTGADWVPRALQG